ncbi:MAG: hypothetical protein R3F19_16430 [Verrucomicrobiales bacterium]
MAISLCLSQGNLNAQQQGVRTIKDFPERLPAEPQAELVPRQGNQVRTALDFERAKAERERLTLEAEAAAAAQAAATANVPVAQNEKEKDTTRYVFSIPGADLVRVATQAGATFSPAGGKLTERGSAAFQMPIHPKAMTSLVQGHIMTQLRPQNFWVIDSTKNRFHMFADAKGKPLQLREGWAVQGIVLKGKNYNWITQPEKGAKSPYFAIEITAYHHADTVVEIAGAHLIGPPGVTQWEEAFVAPGAADDAAATERKTASASRKTKSPMKRGPQASGL